MMLAQANCRELPLAANSVDLIFTDPPYLREFLPCYGWLAQEAARVLRPGGFVLAMCGGLYLNQIFRVMDDAGLTFFWEYGVHLTGWASGIVWTVSFPKTTINVRNKPILAYSKGKNTPRTSTISLFDGTGNDKRFHSWGQDVASARYYIDCFSAPGDLVLDPFIGGGTTAVACELIGRRCVGFDLDPAALDTSAARLGQADILHNLPLFAAPVDTGGQGQ
jgi:hypothetical protein